MRQLNVLCRRGLHPLAGYNLMRNGDHYTCRECVNANARRRRMGTEREAGPSNCP